MRSRALRSAIFVLLFVAVATAEATAARPAPRIERRDLRTRATDANGWMPDVAARLDELRRRNGEAATQALARRGDAAATRQARGSVQSGAGR